MSEIFISHSEEDAGIALSVALALEKAGFRTWTYEVDSVPGPSYLIQTGDAVERAAVVVLVISPASLGSHQVTREVVRGLETGKPFVPLLREVTHVEFQNRQPEWRSAVGAATSIQVPAEGIQTMVPRIIAGLEALGVQSLAGKDKARLDRIAEVLGNYDTRKASRKADGDVSVAASAPAAKQPAASKRLGNSLRYAGFVMVACIVALGIWLWSGTLDKPHGVAVSPEALIEPGSPAEVLDIEAIKDKLLILHDLKGHYVAVIPYWDRESEEHYLFYGDATGMYAQRVHGGGRSGEESFNYAFWDPRFQYAGFVFRDDIYRMECGDSQVIVAPVDKSQAAAILASEFRLPLWKHQAYALARDETGKYYYVDKSLDAERFRLFIGAKGAMQQYEVSEAVTDSGGFVLHTTGARLRVSFEAGEVSQVLWAEGESEETLTTLPIWPNRRFIYSEMTLYPKRLGSACDDA